MAEIPSVHELNLLARMPGFKTNFGQVVDYFSDAYGVGGSPKSVTCLAWLPGETLPTYFPDGEHKVDRGILVVPSDSFETTDEIPLTTDYFNLPSVKDVRYAVKDFTRDGVNFYLQGEAVEVTATGGEHSRIDRG